MKQQWLLLLIILSSYQNITCQISIGASYGIQIPGRQDLKFRFYSDGELLHNIKTTYVKTDITSITNLNVTYWANNNGIKFDYYSWEHYSTAKEFLGDQRPPFNTVEQSRDAILISVMRRFNFPFKKDVSNFSKYYSFFGIGIGEALTDVEQGRNQWRAAFQVFYGVNLPIAKNLSLVTELKLLLTRDADTLSNKDGWFVDTSGRWHPFRFGPHWDTKYHIIQIGLHWNPF